MRAITLSEANGIIAGTFAAARKREAHALAAIVLDAGGRVKAFQKQDGASLLRFEIAYGKAFADDLCAIDGIHAGGLRADADFTGAMARRLNIKIDPPLKDPRKRNARS
jgi:uncharacterized protein GlcG (DUF336 family)